jgi:hypothetical protein
MRERQQRPECERDSSPLALLPAHVSPHVASLPIFLYSSEDFKPSSPKRERKKKVACASSSQSQSTRKPLKHARQRSPRPQSASARRRGADATSDPQPTPAAPPAEKPPSPSSRARQKCTRSANDGAGAGQVVAAPPKAPAPIVPGVIYREGKKRKDFWVYVEATEDEIDPYAVAVDVTAGRAKRHLKSKPLFDPSAARAAPSAEPSRRPRSSSKGRAEVKRGPGDGSRRASSPPGAPDPARTGGKRKRNSPETNAAAVDADPPVRACSPPSSCSTDGKGAVVAKSEAVNSVEAPANHAASESPPGRSRPVAAIGSSPAQLVHANGSGQQPRDGAKLEVLISAAKRQKAEGGKAEQGEVLHAIAAEVSADPSAASPPSPNPPTAGAGADELVYWARDNDTLRIIGRKLRLDPARLLAINHNIAGLSLSAKLRRRTAITLYASPPANPDPAQGKGVCSPARERPLPEARPRGLVPGAAVESPAAAGPTPTRDIVTRPPPSPADYARLQDLVCDRY